MELNTRPHNFAIALIQALTVLSSMVLASCSSSSPAPGAGQNNPSALFSIGGTLSGLQGTVILQNNGIETIALNNSGAFIFSSQLTDGASYSVTILTQPSGQTCSVVNGSGTVSASAVNTISINCVTDRLSVGGTVTGLSGTLSITNNDSSLLSITTNGSYEFAQRLAVGELYNVQVSQNPVAQNCSVNNASGQVGSTDITNVDIVCSTSTTTVTLSGSYQSAPLVAVDSDINDPLATANIDNGTPATAQPIQNLSTVHGFASLSGTGRVGEGDRFASSADEFDSFRVSLQRNQTIRLQVVDFAGTGVFQGDLDLALFDSGLNLVASSNSVGEFESIVVPADGEYLVVVLAFSGSSKYTLSLDGVSVLNARASSSVDFKPGEAVIKFRTGSAVNAFRASNQSINVGHHDTSRATRASFDVNSALQSISARPDQADFEQVIAQSNPDSYEKLKTLQQIKRLNQRQDVEFAEPNYIYRPLLVPNDRFYNLQWHYPAISLPQAWDITTGSRAGSDVIVAVVDTGVFLDHPEFAGQLVSGYDFISSTQRAADGNGIDANPDDPGDSAQLNSSSWHGTHVAGTVAALSNNAEGVAGVAWGAKIMPIRALGVGGGTGFDIIQAARFAAGLSNDSNTVPAQKADIINLSLGGPGFSQAAQNTVNAVRAAGVIVVAAAGNENSSQLNYPASYDGVISVSATGFNNRRAPYSNFGTRIDVAAPGGNQGVDQNNDGRGDGVLSTLVDDSAGSREAALNFYQGTSMAAPHVAGVFALMRAVHPALSPDDIDNLLSAGSISTDIGDPGRDDLYGFGLINALRAVQAAQQLANGGTAPPQPALIVATPAQITLGSGDSSIVTLSNLGDLDTNVVSFTSDSSWLNISAANVDANGLGEYQLSIDRNGLNDSFYVGAITFNLASGNSLVVQVSMLVGNQDSSGDVGTIYMILLDSNDNFVDQVSAIDQGNGVFAYSFNNVSAGAYRIVAGSDVDNDSFICQLAEACGGYPTIDALTTIEAVNSDIDGLDFIIDIFANFGNNALSLNAGAGGFLRQDMKAKQPVPSGAPR